jgi:hypothetical protein
MVLRELPATLPDAARDFLRHASPRILVGLVAACVGLRLALGDFGWADLAIVVGLVSFWPVQEWLIHVFILHYEPVSVFGRRLDFGVPRTHRAHHRDPWRLDLVFIPLQVYLYTPLFLGGAAWLFGSAAFATSFLAAYFALSLYYEWVHFLVHTRYKPIGRLYGRLWRNHRLHHFKNEHYWFGVTMLSGDHLLRTHPARDTVPSSPTARTLGLGEADASALGRA